jgi:hypothetical protein
MTCRTLVDPLDPHDPYAPADASRLKMDRFPTVVLGCGRDLDEVSQVVFVKGVAPFVSRRLVGAGDVVVGVLVVVVAVVARFR